VPFNWCHNPDCHTRETVSRVRGSGTNKVLRTVKITINSNGYPSGIWEYFCGTNCLFNFLNKFNRQIAALQPVREPKETPITVRKEKVNGWRGERIETRIIKG
jgi:hypothetical protein